MKLQTRLERLIDKFIGEDAWLIGQAHYTRWLLVKRKLDGYAGHLVLWGPLLLGIWLIVSGLYHGPNFTAARIVTVESVNVWTWHGRNLSEGEYWTASYTYTPEGGQPRSGYIRVDAWRDVNQQIHSAEVGDKLLLRIPVEGSESGVVFGFNTSVKQGICLIVAWFLVVGSYIYWAVRRSASDSFDEKMAGWLFFGLVLLFFTVMFGVLWLTSPAIDV